MTDGKSYRSETMWTRPSTVGWSPGRDVPVVILFDLGQEATISEVRFATASGINAGVVTVGLRVFVSLDDQIYVLAGELLAPSAKSQSGRHAVQLSLPLDTRARYVAVVAKAPRRGSFVFVDEIEILGEKPADSKSQLPVQVGVTASGAKGLQQLLAGGRRSTNLLANLAGPLKQHLSSWPKEMADAQRDELKSLHRRAIAEPTSYDTLRAELTESHRIRARQVYGAETLVWETVPDDRFTMLSLPPQANPSAAATIHTVVNALEATALGVANLSNDERLLKIDIVGHKEGAPKLISRVGWFFVTSNAQYIPDALLASDAPQTIPPGESKLVWIEAESTGAKPGVYDYEVSVRVGQSLHTIPLTVHVHNVVLDRKTPLVTGNFAYLNTGEGQFSKKCASRCYRIGAPSAMVPGEGRMSFPQKMFKAMSFGLCNWTSPRWTSFSISTKTLPRSNFRSIQRSS